MVDEEKIKLWTDVVSFPVLNSKKSFLPSLKRCEIQPQNSHFFETIKSND